MSEGDIFARSCVFEPEAAAALRLAFERGWQALNFAVDPSDNNQIEHMKVELAKAIIEVAARGIRTPVDLTNAALGQMPPMAGVWMRQPRLT